MVQGERSIADQLQWIDVLSSFDLEIERVGWRLGRHGSSMCVHVSVCSVAILSGMLNFNLKFNARYTLRKLFFKLPGQPRPPSATP